MDKKIDDTGNSKKKELSWNDEKYLTKVKLEDATKKACSLEQKSSLGPCFRVAAPFGRPSGIAICLAKRCANPELKDHKPAKSMINLSLSKRLLINKTIYREPYICIQTQKRKSTPIVVPDQDTPKRNLLGTIKETISNMGGKIKNAFG